jgi:hypothetical protein
MFCLPWAFLMWSYVVTTLQGFFELIFYPLQALGNRMILFFIAVWFYVFSNAGTIFRILRLAALAVIFFVGILCKDPLEP